MLPQPFQTNLEEMGFPDGPDFPQAFAGGGVPQDGGAEPQGPRRPVQVVEPGMQQGIAAGETDLALNPFFPTESIQVVQNFHPLLPGQGGARTAVVTMPAVEVAGLGDVPLKGKGRGLQEFPLPDDALGIRRRVSSDLRPRGDQESLPHGPLQGVLDGRRRDPPGGGGGFQGHFLQHDLQDQQVFFPGRAGQHFSRLRLPPDQDQILSRFRSRGFRFSGGLDQGDQVLMRKLQQMQGGVDHHPLRVRITLGGIQARLIKGPFQTGQIKEEIGAVGRRGSLRQKPGELLRGPSGPHLGAKVFPVGRPDIRTA